MTEKTAVPEYCRGGKKILSLIHISEPTRH